MIKDRLVERLKAVRLTSFDASIMLGLNRGYINDFLIGKGKSFKKAKPEKIAELLECSVEYLTGESDDVGLKPSEALAARLAQLPHPANSNGLPIVGAVETDTFRPAGVHPARVGDTLPIAPDPRYRDVEQVLYLVRDNSVSRLAVTEGMALLVATYESLAEKRAFSPEQGSVLVVKRTRPSGEFETSVRKLAFTKDETKYEAMAAFQEHQPIVCDRGSTTDRDGARIDILGLVLTAVRVL